MTEFRTPSKNLFDLRAPKMTPDFNWANENPGDGVEFYQDKAKMLQDYWDRVDSWERANEEASRRLRTEKLLDVERYNSFQTPTASVGVKRLTLEDRLTRLSGIFKTRVKDFNGR